MWVKFILITVYVCLLFIVLRIVDIAVKTYELKSLSLFPSRLVVNPVALSVRQLKKILDNRGVNYDGIVEKHQLRNLIEASGECEAEELSDLDTDEDEDEAKQVNVSGDNDYVNETATTGFTCGTHLYELVEDTKDSAWLVLVKPYGGRSLFYDKIWSQVVRKASTFGIRTGVFDCAKDPSLCENKSWFTSRLLLALPREGLQSKEDIVFMTYLIGPNSNLRSIFNWLHQQLSRRVVDISTEAELRNNWLKSNNNTNNKVALVFISTLAMPPLILSALAIKFSGRVKFGMFRVNEKQRNFSLFDMERKLPILAIIFANKQGIYLYQQKPGENFNYKSIELLLKWIKPEMNDVFYLSLLLMNIGLALNCFWMRCSKFWKHIVYSFVHLVKFNCCFFLVWLIILTLYNFPIMNSITDRGLALFQMLVISDFAAIIRYDLQYYYKLNLTLVVFLLLGCLLAIVRRKFFSLPFDDNDEDYLFRDWTPWESTLLACILFRPMGMNLRPSASLSFEANLEEEMELLIERLAVPNLWLQPELISDVYIKELPVWLYANSNNEGSEDSSETHSEAEETTKHSSDSVPEADHGEESVSVLAKTKTASDDLKGNKVKAKKCLNRAKTDKTSRDLKAADSRAPDGMLLLKECAICLEAYRKGQLICGLPCGHNYHEQCIMPWLYRDNHCCPTCRWPSYKSKQKVS
ncbi:E3 ubiquitin-protein ligase RNF103-like protein [Dinothrombium tinctorium]|uniref:E3 ubiquitin-protein ligase RNF103-like protein n=1 Tax=Dinothrombium tinctorium TaxID=1965070 RepID=A0A3S4QDB6_9ACAR|nr:E3 ubiquitin-protein ligase RNF103-like protein [Dinothrombium tinctorium]